MKRQQHRRRAPAIALRDVDEIFAGHPVMNKAEAVIARRGDLHRIRVGGLRATALLLHLDDLLEAAGALSSGGAADCQGDRGEHSDTDEETRLHDQPLVNSRWRYSRYGS